MHGLRFVVAINTYLVHDKKSIRREERVIL